MIDFLRDVKRSKGKKEKMDRMGYFLGDKKRRSGKTAFFVPGLKSVHESCPDGPGVVH